MTTHGLTPCTEMVKGFWASSSGAPAFPFKKERAESATRLLLTITVPESFKNFSTFEIIFRATAHWITAAEECRETRRGCVRSTSRSVWL